MSMALRWGLLLSALAVFLGGVWWVSNEALEATVAEVPVTEVPVADFPVAEVSAVPLPVPDEAPPAPVPPAPAPEAAAVAPGPNGPFMPRPGKSLPDPEALARENALLERARHEVTEDPERALRSVLEHEQLFPDGALARDAKLVELEAFLRLGRTQDAQTLARKLTANDSGAKKAVKRLLSEVRQN
jgi:hypothetical protein